MLRKFSDIEIGHQHLISVTNLVTLTSHDSWVTADLTSRWPTISSESVLNQSLRVNYGIINTLFRLSSWLTFQPNPFSPIHPIESSLTRLLAEAREYSRRDEAIAALAKVSDSCHFPETVQRQQVNFKFIGGLRLDCIRGGQVSKPLTVQTGFQPGRSRTP